MASSKPAKRRKLNPLPENYSTCQSSNITKEITGIANLEQIDNSTCDVACRNINHSSRRGKMSELAAEKSWVAVKMPSEAELEEFFSAAEKQINKQFTDKYNFDAAKERPLEGRYEWVKIKP